MRPLLRSCRTICRSLAWVSFQTRTTPARPRITPSNDRLLRVSVILRISTDISVGNRNGRIGADATGSGRLGQKSGGGHHGSRFRSVWMGSGGGGRRAVGTR